MVTYPRRDGVGKAGGELDGVLNRTFATLIKRGTEVKGFVVGGGCYHGSPETTILQDEVAKCLCIIPQVQVELAEEGEKNRSNATLIISE